MKSLFLFTFIFILFINLVLNEQLPKSFYSYLLEDVREEVVDAALLRLPKRTSVDILKMCISMKNEKTNVPLSDIEAAFLIYKWITRNMNINCVDYNKEESPVAVYNSGVGSFVGISALFNIMCSNMNIESVSITGFNKRLDNLEKNNRLYTKVEHYWNYIFINNTYYLVDPTLACGFCYGTYFQKEYVDFYFGTKPEFLIKTHFPTKEKNQFLDNKISEEKWDQLIMRTPHFYLNGFITITPENLNINLKDEKKIVITYSDSLKNENVKIGCGVVGKDHGITMNRDIKEVDGGFEISLENVDNDAMGLLIYSGDIGYTSALYNIVN